MKARILITDEMVADALQSGAPVTDVLARKYEGEIQDRISADERLKGMDAFQLAMMDAGISKYSRIQDFYQTGDNEWLFPVYIDRKLREEVGSMNLLPYLVSSIESAPSLSIRGSKLEMDEANKDATTLKRVNEGTDLPLAVIKLADVATSLYKRGRAVQATYETLMFMSINMFGKHLDMIANDVSGQQAGDAIDVLVNGDGNKNPADVTTMTATSLTVEELVGFAIEFWRSAKVPLDTIVCGDGAFYQKLLTTTFNKDEVNGMIAGATFNFPQAMLHKLDVLYDPRVPKANSKEQLIGLNRSYALVKHVAQGSQIREIAKNIRNQTNLGTISEIAGFEKLNNKASRVLRAK